MRLENLIVMPAAALQTANTGAPTAEISSVTVDDEAGLVTFSIAVDNRNGLVDGDLALVWLDADLTSATGSRHCADWVIVTVGSEGMLELIRRSGRRFVAACVASVHAAWAGGYRIGVDRDGTTTLRELVHAAPDTPSLRSCDLALAW